MKNNSARIVLVSLVIGVFLFLLLRLVNFSLIKKDNPDDIVTQPSDLNASVCDPNNGPFSLDIDNQFFPLPLGLVHILEGDSFKVQFSVLNETRDVAGVLTRVVEEREWEDDTLIEVSRNYFAAAPDGTVCYFGEDVDEYKNGEIVGHGGSWLAGVGQNRPGIIMPANPSVGQTYQIEYAPGIAEDRARHVSMEESFTTPAGTFANVLLVEETPSSTKRYQPGIGLIFDDGAVLTEY